MILHEIKRRLTLRRLTLTQWMDILFILFFCGMVPCTQESPKEPPITVSMIEIPAGEFTMGAGGQIQRISLATYFIDKTEVTNEVFEKFILADGYEKKEYWTEVGWNFIVGGLAKGYQQQKSRKKPQEAQMAVSTRGGIVWTFRV